MSLMCFGTGSILTHICHHLISASPHNFVVVPAPKLRERGQSRDLHPHLEVLIAGELGELCVAIGVSGSPVWRWKIIGGVPGRFVGVLFVLILPRDPLVGKVVSLT